MERKIVFLLIIISFIGGMALTLVDISSPIDNSTNTSEIGEGVAVIDCINRSYTCEKSRIDSRRVSCEPWQPWHSYEKLDCDKTEQVENITMITDPANYIDIERTHISYDVEKVANTGPEPWDLAFLPDGNKIWTLIDGKLIVEDSGNLNRYDVPSIRHGEAGLMGIAIDPNFSENQHIYLYYTWSITNETSNFTSNRILENRISRFKLTETGLKNEKILQTVPGSKYHSGGRLRFGPDGKLYATTGDADNPKAAFNSKNFLGGKILRMNTDGTVPEDNPFNSSLVYSEGHRNPQGIAWNPENNQLYNSEHGPWRYDELNRVNAGENYGWGKYKCGSTNPIIKNLDIESFNYSQPVRCFENWTMAPSGMTFVDEKDHPWYGDLFLAGLRGKQIYRAEIEDGRIVEEETFYISKDEDDINLRLRNVNYQNGSLYILGDKRGLYRITPEG